MNPDPKRNFIALFALAILLGISAGLLDALAIHSKFFTTDRIAYVPWRVWLVSPAAWVVFSLAIAGLLVLFRLRTVAEPLLVAGVLGAFVTVRTVILFRVIRPQSGILISFPLALLLTLSLAYTAFRGRFRLRQFATGVVPLMASVLAAGLLAGALAAAPHQPSSQRRTPDRAPNIVFIVLDTLRYD